MLINFVLILISVTYLTAKSIDTELYDLTEVEFPRIGKFHRTDFFDPLHRPVLFLPDSPQRIGTRFLLFTPTNPVHEERLYSDNVTSIKASSFDPKLNTKFIVHGFIDDLVIGGWMRQIKDEMLKIGKFNIIIVDWSEGNEPPYGQATVNTRVVGALIANLVEDIKSVHNISFGSVHVIGHSLGSHIAGYAGERLKTMGRITGLDPAGPFFEHTVPACRLDPTDALFVDSIHSNSHTFGMNQEVSHIDFFPNSGDSQPKCGVDHQILKLLTDGIIEGVKQLSSCNHQRAIDYFIETIDKKDPPIAYTCKDYETFVKGKCTECGPEGDQCAVVGPKVEEWKKFSKTGTYVRMYFKTKGEKPYLLNEYAIKVKLSAPKDHTNQHGILYATIHGSEDTETIQLSESDEILLLGTTMTYLATTLKELGEIQSVTFKWHHSFSLFTAVTYVEDIEITPMFVLENSQRNKMSAKFCSPSPDSPIAHDTETPFKKC